jgi:hypothetical protein
MATQMGIPILGYTLLTNAIWSAKEHLLRKWENKHFLIEAKYHRTINQ